MAKKRASQEETATPVAFDPLAVENVGVTLAVELLEQPLDSMPPANPFAGAGIYALYYSGKNKAYAALTKLDAGKFKYPVYIGKASGENSKQGFNSQPKGARKLFQRICEHAASIEAVENLELRDFKCRYLVLNDAYISLAEAVMIRVFRPPWNGMSFGSKVVGKNRMEERRVCGMSFIRDEAAGLRAQTELMKLRG